MTMVKIYRNLTTKEIGIFKTTEVDKTDGRIHYLLEVKDQQGTPTEKRVLNTTFKRWWKLVEEVPANELQQALNRIYSPEEEVPTMEDLKELNDSGVELTEEELKMFNQQSQEKAKTVVKEKKPVKKKESTGVVEYFEDAVKELGGSVTEYSEPMKRVIKDQSGKTIIFYVVRPNNSVKLYLKDQVDEVATNGILAVEQNTYPKQFPFRVEVKQLDEDSKKLFAHILEAYM